MLHANANLSAPFSSKPKAPRPQPFSRRLSGEERLQLEAEAQGMPLGANIKGKTLNGLPLKRASAVEDRRALAQALALLGKTRYANNLNQLAHLAKLGALPLTPEAMEELEGQGKLTRFLGVNLVSPRTAHLSKIITDPKDAELAWASWKTLQRQGYDVRFINAGDL